MKKPLTYRDAGVDIAAGNTLVERIKPHSQRTLRPEILAGIGGFAALCEIPLSRYQQPVLVSSTDGVGTKLLLAQQWQQLSHIGIDLVAMCANDIIVSGAEPLFFLDYFACGALDIAQAETVIASIAEACHLSHIALVGGETAEMPGLYRTGEFDLAGFCVGLVEKTKIIDGSHLQAGHRLIGIASSGPHANGYSLIRRILKDSQTQALDMLAGKTFAEWLLTPTQLYIDLIQQLQKTHTLLAMAHITGGGLIENIPRVIPKQYAVQLQADAWTRPVIFDWLQETGHVPQEDCWRTFNNGIGFVLCVPRESVTTVIADIATLSGLAAWEIGEITTRKDNEPACQIHP